MDEAALDDALRTEREFVHTLGGFSLQLAGATLVTHERVPVPRFNFVQDLRLSVHRQTGSLERALDHYFQRALRPEFRIREPAPAHLVKALGQLGFRRRPGHWALFEARPGTVGPGRDPFHVRAALPADLEALMNLWTHTGERDELRRAIEVAWTHPNPGERLVPMVALRGDAIVSAALVYTFRRAGFIDLVATRPGVRGQGAASTLVSKSVGSAFAEGAATVSIASENPRLDERLTRLGFRRMATFDVFDLPEGSDLHLPPPGPPQPPRWRPPRKHA